MSISYEVSPGVVFEDPEDCPTCATPFAKTGGAFSKVLEARDIDSHLGTFEIWRCGTCGIGLTVPQPTIETTAHLYATQLTPDFDIVRGSFIDRIKDLIADYEVRRLVRGRKALSCLDFGAGNGRFAFALARILKDASVTAVDFEKNHPPSERSYFGRNFTYASYNEFHSTFNRYDVIFLRHVLEHTADPIQLVRELSERLTNGGIMYVEVPNLESGLARIFGQYYPGYYVPRHLVHFTYKSLQRTLDLPGYHVTVGRTNNMPLMGNILANLFRGKRSQLIFQVAGIPLYALQLMIEACFRSSTCLKASVTRMV